ncbi:hypothetical protein BO94DRAFT_540783 [Aspergillus sclerotioniger CBS 115572]|uniref:Uncharacterized protein n=1 Tax=Aspergillus sclerotioniger CBS 115572 TaxID=1450535 RepID=A0A317UYT7_9EURO|nr:hypothetical protein BO94DRAFT_540783 [Aspergillus sclerotioniger CBS 115572]PWY65662.1 hypothetical protein BO94DRAFT_540783 [Aspergillus sclerotioniger CBS 115572]
MAHFYEALDCPDLFCLVRTPDQAEYDGWGTPLPVSDFSTGFKDATDAELRLFTQTKIKELGENKNAGRLEPDWIAVLDERSPRDATVVLHYNEALSLWAQSLEDAEVPFHIPGDADVSEGKIWWKWRLPISGAHHLFNSVDGGDFVILGLYSRPEYKGADGVVNVEIPYKIICGEIKDPINQEKYLDTLRRRYDGVV